MAADGANSKVRKYLVTVSPACARLPFLEGNIPQATVLSLWQLM